MRRYAALILGLALLAGCPNDDPSGTTGTVPADGAADGSGDGASDGASDAGPAGPSTPGLGGVTPEDCYQRMEQAFKTQDFATYYDLMTKESQDELLPAMTLLAGMAAGEDDAGVQTYKAILAKYGVENLDAEPKPGPQPKPIELFKDVTDRRGLFNEIMRFALSRQTDRPEIIGLEGLKIDGDKASGTIVRMADGKQERDPAVFKKVDGRWYADVQAGGQ